MSNVRNIKPVNPVIFFLRREFSKAAHIMAHEICPEQNYHSLEACYKNASQIRGMVQRIAHTPNAEVRYLADCVELQPDGFSSYSDLTEFWKRTNQSIPKDDENRIRYPNAFKIFREATQFTHNFEELPKMTRCLVNASLSLQKTIISEYIENKAGELTLST